MKQMAVVAAKSLQSCLTLCNSIDGSPPGSPVPGILQARTLEWVAIAFSGSRWQRTIIISVKQCEGVQVYEDLGFCFPPATSLQCWESDLANRYFDSL